MAITRKPRLALIIVRPAHAATFAQQPTRVHRIGFLGSRQPTPTVQTWWDACIRGLRDHGWVEHQNIAIVRRHPRGSDEKLSEVAAELVGLGVEVIVVASTTAALAAKQATATIPIVMANPGDPVATGLVSSLARPGGNVTGLSFLGTELAGKQVGLLVEALPKLSRLAVLMNPANASHTLRLKEAEAAARMLEVQIEALEVGTPSDVEPAFVTMRTRRAGALLVLADSLFTQESGRLATLALKQRAPTMFGLREHVVAGGLIAYGVSFTDLFHRAAAYVDKILRGARPADLPVEQPTKFELVINLRTAKALGLTIPQSVLARADEVIQ
jgi:putative ABC transport system substrate-binding protein